MYSPTTPQMTTIFCIPWEDIICKKILIQLNLKEAYRTRRVSKQFYQLSQLYLLKYCKVMDFHLIGKRLRFNGEVFKRILANKNNLLELNMEDCGEWLSDEDVHPVLRSNAMSLRKLSTRNCCNLTEAPFETLELMTNLTHIDLSHCRDVPNKSMVRLGSNVSTLVSVNLSHCWFVQDDAIETIAKNNVRLEELRVKSCFGVSDSSVVVVARMCVGLRVLDVRGCWRITDVSVYEVRLRCPMCRLFVKTLQHWYDYEDQADDEPED